MKTTRQEKLLKYLTPERRKKFKLIDNEFFVFNETEQQFLPYIFTKKQYKNGVKYFDNYYLEQEVYIFLLNNYKNEVTPTEVRGLIKLIPTEI